MMNISPLARLAIAATVALATAATATRAAENRFVGNWALTIPGGGAGWLGVTQSDGQLKAEILWGGGSVLPVQSAALDGERLVLTRVSEQKPGGKAKGPGKKITETITAAIEGDTLKLSTVKRDDAGKEFAQADFTGKRIPPLPPAPDIAKVKQGTPIKLFNGKDLSGWKPTSTELPNGWSVKDGVLDNNAPQEEGKKHIRYANLRTEQEFEDFALSLDVRVPEKGNSGVYLRGIYEVQISDSYGKPLDSHNMGAIYSRITPKVNAEKPAGEWQHMEIALIDRHVTVMLNGVCIIDNQPLLGCTGGALTSNESRPGPIYLQGDHTSVQYRNMVLTPITR